MHFYQALRQNLHPLVDNTCVSLYASAAWPWNGREQRLLPAPSAPRPTISLIATVFNEGETITEWLEALLAQTRPPDEIVIVDGGSTDGTFETLQALAQHSPVPLKIHLAAGANIARGRNLAIEQAAGPIIACTDAGCQVPPDWLANLTGPFAVDPELEVVAGYYEAVQHSDLQRVMSVYFVTPPTMVDPQNFLPSARSLAFHKRAWQAAGGFPEWLTLTAEDTLFDLALKQHTRHWAFVPEATVRWYLKESLPGLFRQVRAYGRGDGEAGLFPEQNMQRMRFWRGIGGGGLLAFVCLALAVSFRSRLGLLPALVCALWLARRLWQTSLRPRLQIDGQVWPHGWFGRAKINLLSVIVNGTISLGLTLGYAEGVRQRLRKETASCASASTFVISPTE